MAGPLGTRRQPITLEEIENMVTISQEDLKEALAKVRLAEGNLLVFKRERDHAQRQLEVWQGCAKLLKDLP